MKQEEANFTVLENLDRVKHYCKSKLCKLWILYTLSGSLVLHLASPTPLLPKV